MRNPINKVCIFGALILAASFWSCSTDSDVVTVGEDEYNGIHLVDDSVLGDDNGSADDENENGEEAKSSSSKKAEKATSSSSKQKEAKSSSSSKTKAASSSSKPTSSSAKQESSSSTKDSDKKVSSSSKPASNADVKNSSSSKKEETSADSKEEAKSSSSKKGPHIPGLEETVASSSSKADTTAVKPASSSSSSEAKPDTTSNTEAAKDTIDKDTTTIISDNNQMDKLDSNEQKEIEDLVNSGDSSVTQIDSLKIESDSLDFENNDYYCKAPDGSWYRLKENSAKTFWKILWDITVYIFTGHHYYDFTKACEELYMRPKG